MTAPTEVEVLLWIERREREMFEGSAERAVAEKARFDLATYYAAVREGRIKASDEPPF